MKKVFLIFSAIVALAAASCKMPGSGGDRKGHIVVSNQSPDNVKITEIYLKSEYSEGFSKVFDGEIHRDRNYCLEVSPAPYAVRITVFYPLTIVEGDGLGVTKQFETGYNIYKEAKEGDYIYADFDGSGICFR